MSLFVCRRQLDSNPLQIAFYVPVAPSKLCIWNYNNPVGYIWTKKGLDGGFSSCFKICRMAATLDDHDVDPLVSLSFFDTDERLNMHGLLSIYLSMYMIEIMRCLHP